MRLLHALSYFAFIVGEVIKGSAKVARLALSREAIAEPAIVELVTRARTDLEITLLASSITITPGTLVLGIAAADGERPPSLFVHSLFDSSNSLDGLRDLESRLLRATRKGGQWAL